MVFPIENGRPNSRGVTSPLFGLRSGFSPLCLSPIAGTPDVTVPAGKASYRSRVSDQEESMPISVSVVSSPGGSLLYVHGTIR